VRGAKKTESRRGAPVGRATDRGRRARSCKRVEGRTVKIKIKKQRRTIVYVYTRINVYYMSSLRHGRLAEHDKALLYYDGRARARARCRRVRRTVRVFTVGSAGPVRITVVRAVPNRQRDTRPNYFCKYIYSPSAGLATGKQRRPPFPVSVGVVPNMRRRRGRCTIVGRPPAGTAAAAAVGRHGRRLLQQARRPPVRGRLRR